MKVTTKSKKVNKAWLNDHINDPYVKLAQKDGYRARAAYKLKEIDETLRLIHPGQVVVDLGSAPGAWSQYLRRRFAPTAPGRGGGRTQWHASLRWISCRWSPSKACQFIQGDFREEAVAQALTDMLAGKPVDVVVSDMAPNLSGIESSDAARVAHLVELALDFAVRHLAARGRPGGARPFTAAATASS
jgi:23S rRNA (uridine2552-2'-O)-methyltransferase